MDCCCCTTASTEVHYTESPRYKRAAHAIDAENTEFFAQTKWSSNLTEKQIVGLFNYALSRQTSPEIINYILRENLKSLIAAERGFVNILLTALVGKTDQICLESILQYKSANIDLFSLRKGVWQKSLLHLCAEAGNLLWLKYFVENLNFSNEPACWLDNTNTDPLYYAAVHGHLDVTKYLVEQCGRKPTPKICSRATGSSKEYLQKYNLLTYRTEPLPCATASHMYQHPKRCSTEAALDNYKETTPLLAKVKKQSQ